MIPEDYENVILEYNFMLIELLLTKNCLFYPKTAEEICD
jgi:hypothetical protein